MTLTQGCVHRKCYNTPGFRLLDVFHITISKNRCYLSKRMTERAAYTKYGNLNLGLLHIKDIFLLKPVADKHTPDILKIVKTTQFDWAVVRDEMKKQEQSKKSQMQFLVENQLEQAIEYTAMRL
jgi:hypothetical protein